MRPFSVLTEDEKTAIQAKAQAAREAKKAWAEANLRRDFLDSEEWDRLASVRGVRLPLWSEPCKLGAMRRWLGKLRLTEANIPDLAAFVKDNANWPLRAWAGLMLEERDRLQNRAPSPANRR